MELQSLDVPRQAKVAVTSTQNSSPLVAFLGNSLLRRRTAARRCAAPCFERALTPEGFAEVNVDPETGTVCWPGGADLYERVHTGVWPEQNRAA
jgi:hypothetical protein